MTSCAAFVSQLATRPLAYPKRCEHVELFPLSKKEISEDYKLEGFLLRMHSLLTAGLYRMELQRVLYPLNSTVEFTP